MQSTALISGELENIEETQSTDSSNKGKRKMTLASSNFNPRKKPFKKGKLKKPQSQKEPSHQLRNDLVGTQANIGRSGFYKDDRKLVQGYNRSPDIPTGSGNMGSYGAQDHTTASSSDSMGYYNYPQGYQPNMMQMHPQPVQFMPHGGYGVYPPGYYPQPVHQPPPGLVKPIPMQPMGVQNDNLSEVSAGNSQTSHQRKRSIESPDKLSTKPIKKGKGLRKVKSTNEKSMPIDPQARSLIYNCEKVSSVQEKLDQLKGNLDLLIYNQSGSRFLQKILTKANNTVIEFFLEEIDSSLNKLMMDRYGNYF